MNTLLFIFFTGVFIGAVLGTAHRILTHFEKVSA